MSNITITTKTPAQIDAEFDAAFQQRKPAAAPKPLTQADRLGPYRKAILRQRRRGFSWKEIAEVMALPPISEKVGEKTLRETFGKLEKAPSAVPSRAAATVAAADPAAVPAAPTPPMTPQEHQRFDPLFRDLIHGIVVTKMKRHDAHQYANNAVEMWRPADVQRFHQVLDAELDALTTATCPNYDLPPEAFAPWKRRWE